VTFFFTFLFVILVFLRPQEWLFPWLYGVNLLDGVVILALLAFLMEINAGRIHFPRKMPQAFLIIGFFFSGIMSHVAHTYFAGILWTIPDMFKICFFTLLLLCVIDNTRRLRLIAWVFVIMACLMAVHLLMQQKLGYGFGGQEPMYQKAWGTHRAGFRSKFFGIFDDPNDTAQFLATSIPFAFALTRRWTVQSFLLGCAITWFLLLGFQTTDSRGGLVALLTVFAVMFILLLPARWLPWCLGGFGLAALAACPLSAGFLDPSAHERVVFWGQANWAFKANPLFGVGYGMFSDYISKARAAHNMFVLCYTSLGVFGYWFWFGLLQLGFVGAWRTRSVLRNMRDPDAAWLRRFAGLSMASMAGFTTSGYFLSRAFIFPLYFLLAILAVVPELARRFLGQNRPLFDMQRDVGLWVTVGSLLSIVYIYFSILLLNKTFYGL